MKERRGIEIRRWYVRLIVVGGGEGKGSVKSGWERLDGGGGGLREGEVPCWTQHNNEARRPRAGTGEC